MQRENLGYNYKQVKQGNRWMKSTEPLTPEQSNLSKFPSQNVTLDTRSPFSQPYTHVACC